MANDLSLENRGPVFSLRNRARGTVTATSEDAAGHYGPDWLLSTRTDRSWRSDTIVLSGWDRIILDLGETDRLDVFGVFGTNLGEPDFRVRTFATLPGGLGSLDAGAGTELQESAWLTATVEPTTPGAEYWEMIAERQGESTLDRFVYFPEAQPRYVFFEFSYTAGSGSGNLDYDYVEVLDVWAGRLWIPTGATVGGVSLGATWGIDDPSTVGRLEGGGFAGTQRPRHRTLEVGFTRLRIADADLPMRDWYATGVTGRAFALTEVDDPGLYYPRQIYGAVTSLGTATDAVLGDSPVDITGVRIEAT